MERKIFILTIFQNFENRQISNHLFHFTKVENLIKVEKMTKFDQIVNFGKLVKLINRRLGTPN